MAGPGETQSEWSIFLATPAYGGMVTTTFMSSVLALTELCRERGVGLEVRLHGGDALISRARSKLATEFLEKTAHTHMFFVDADIGFTPEHVLRLLDADKDLVGGVCPAKVYNWEKIRQAALAGAADLAAAGMSYVVRFLPSETQSVELDDEGFGPVAYVGTGMMMIRRQALERVAAAFPDLRARMSDVTDVHGRVADDTIMFFAEMIDPETRIHLSEDYAFCNRWRAVGGEIWADFVTPTVHVGHAAYRGSLMKAVGR